MIDQQAKVIEITSDTVWLEAQRQSTCQQCKMKQGCGTTLLARHVGQRFNRIAVNSTHPVKVGQHVSLMIPEQALLQGTMLIYLLPILLLIGIAVLANVMGAGEGMQILAGGLGLGLGLIISHQVLQRKKADFQVSMKEE